MSVETTISLEKSCLTSKHYILKELMNMHEVYFIKQFGSKTE